MNLKLVNLKLNFRQRFILQASKRKLKPKPQRDKSPWEIIFDEIRGNKAFKKLRRSM